MDHCVCSPVAGQNSGLLAFIVGNPARSVY
jgi:hypothetical protein